MKKFIVTTKNSFKKDFITHEDQEVNGLKFRHFNLDNSSLTVVSGVANKITAWANRIMGNEISDVDAKTLFRDMYQKNKINRLAELDREKLEEQKRKLNFVELIR